MAITINKKNAVIFCLLVSGISNAQAFSNVDMTAGISGNMYYTDNVDLTDTNEESDLVMRITPRIGVTTEGSRLRTQLNYSVSGMSYNQTSGNNDVYHNLSSTANAEIVKNSIFLDGFANTRQVLLDQNKNASSDQVSGSQNTTTTYTYGLTPTWKKKWGNYADSELSYAYNEVKFGGGSNQSDSTGDRIHFLMSSGTKFAQYFWDLNYDHNETTYDSSSNSTNARDTKTETSYVTLGYHYSRQLDVRTRLGYENYDNTVDDGFGWTVGGNWHPNERTSLDLSLGERAFGKTAAIDFSHRTRRITWKINYKDDVTNSRGQIINNSQAINDANANPDPNAPPNVNVPLSTYNPNLRLTRRLTSSAAYKFSKSTVTLSVYAEAIYYEDADRKDNNNQGIALDWNLRMNSRTSFLTGISWDKLDQRANSNSLINNNQIGNKQDRTRLFFRFTRQLNSDLSGSIGYTYRKNNADLSTSEYTENRISATLSKRF